MPKFIETICVLNGEIQNFDRHLARIRATQEKHFGRSMLIPTDPIRALAATSVGRAKLRFTYDAMVIYDIEVTPYNIRHVEKLRLVHDNAILYQEKSEDRSALQRLHEGTSANEEIIIVKQGYLTDTSYTNIALYDGTQWVTPTTPLLAGTRRAALIAQGKLTERPIRETDLPQYEKISLINAMMDLGEIVIPMQQVK